MKKIFLLLALLPLAAFAEESCYTVDPARSEVTFEAEQAGTPFSGNFREFGGEICLGEESGHIDAWLDPSSVDSGLPELDAVLQGKEFFDTAEHPRAQFASDDVSRNADGTWRARGTLTLKGTAREMTVPFTFDRSRMEMRGELAFKRLDFNVGTGEWADTEWLGATVRVTFRASVVSKR